MTSKQIKNKLNEYDSFIKESKELMTNAIIEHCHAKRGNIKELAEQCGMNYNQLIRIVNRDSRLTVSVKRLLSIYEFIA
jgi:hypothetical protein